MTQRHSPPLDDLAWIFAYGSLMWDPDFEPLAVVPVVASGWHRKFGFLSTINWGTHQDPGAVAALYRGGSCSGLALGIAKRDAKAVVARLDRREAFYLRKKVKMQAARGFTLTGITYIASSNRTKFKRRNLEGNIHDIPGRKGSSLEYLKRVVGTLETHGFQGTDAHGLLNTVSA